MFSVLIFSKIPLCNRVSVFSVWKVREKRKLVTIATRLFSVSPSGGSTLH